jgi:polyphosphate kinase
VEVVVPVEDPALRQELRTVLDAQLTPGRGAWEMQPDGSYVRVGDSARNSQQVLVEQAEKRRKEASRRRKRRTRSFARRSGK